MLFHYPKVTTLLIFTILAGFCYGQSSPKPHSRALRIAKVMDVSADVEPTMDSLRHGVGRLLDGKLPKDKAMLMDCISKDPVVTDLGKKNWCNTSLFSGLGEG